VPDGPRLWVVDTSALIEVRRPGLPRTTQEAVFEKLTSLARAEQLVFPPQVMEELERGVADSTDDQALAWARSVRADAERRPDLETVRQVLARAPNLIDPTSTRDQADPYVIALALEPQTFWGVSILSNDVRDHGDGRGGFRKLSIVTVAGLWDIPVVPLAGFVLRFLAARD